MSAVLSWIFPWGNNLCLTPDSAFPYSGLCFASGCYFLMEIYNISGVIFIFFHFCCCKNYILLLLIFIKFFELQLRFYSLINASVVVDFLLIVISLLISHKCTAFWVHCFCSLRLLSYLHVLFFNASPDL